MTTLHIIAGLLGLAIALVLMAMGAAIYMAHCWSRFEKVCGGYRQAMNVLHAAEAVFAPRVGWWKRIRGLR